jgi:hypothetical protein
LCAVASRNQSAFLRSLKFSGKKMFVINGSSEVDRCFSVAFNAGSMDWLGLRVRILLLPQLEINFDPGGSEGASAGFGLWFVI